MESVGALEQIRQVAARRVQHATERAAIDDELAQLVQHAFKEGKTGPEIAQAAGLSPERVYQIRDGRR